MNRHLVESGFVQDQHGVLAKKILYLAHLSGAFVRPSCRSINMAAPVISELEYSPPPLLTLEELKSATDVVAKSTLCHRTPLLTNVQHVFGVNDGTILHLKLENMQKTGSFKTRGLSYQLHNMPSGVVNGKLIPLTFSGGNYGKAFACALSEMGLTGTVVMPDTVPANRVDLIQSYGMVVELVPSSKLQSTIDHHIREDRMVFFDPCFSDPDIIAGHASAGFEILEDCADPDVVVVCCGGGGLLAGIATAVKLSGSSCRIYGVEPEAAPTMYESFRRGRPVSMDIKRTVATGLSPPRAGTNTFRHCQQFVEDIFLVSDSQIIDAMWKLYNAGLLVEPSGAAALAALLCGKIPDVAGKTVVVVISGGNVTPEELVELRKGS